MNSNDPKCPKCGGEREFYPSAVLFNGATIPTKGCHCLHCGYELSDAGEVVSEPRDRSEWIGV